MGEVIKGPWGASKAVGESFPDDIVAIVDKFPGLSLTPGGIINGKDAILPDGRTVSGNGYTRTTGQWRENMEVMNRYDVEVVCLKTMKHGWVDADKLEGFFKIEELA